MKRTIKVPAVSNKPADIPPDEYSWRKYGQKPIKGSPHPRYFGSPYTDFFVILFSLRNVSYSKFHMEVPAFCHFILFFLLYTVN